MSASIAYGILLHQVQNHWKAAISERTVRPVSSLLKQPPLEFRRRIMSNIFASAYQLNTRYPLPDGLHRKAGLWMGISINCGLTKPIYCNEHRVLLSATFGVSYLCTFGKYKGGNLILWSCNLMQNYNLATCFFPDHLLTHSNSEAVGLGIRQWPLDVK